MITRAQVGAAEKVVDRSGVSAFVEGCLGEDAGVGGRPNPLSIRTVLVAMFLTASDQREMTARRVHKTMTLELHPRSRRRLGCLRPDGAPFTYEQVVRRIRAIINVLDGSPYFAGRDLDEAARAVRDNRLQLFSDRLLDATLPTDIPHEGSYALDSTNVDSWAAPVGYLTNRADGSGSFVAPERRGRRAADGAPFQVREWGVADPDAAKYKHKANDRKKAIWGFGYELQAAVWVGEDAGQPVPMIAARIQVFANRHGNGARTAEMVERLVLDGFPLSDILADGEYPHYDGWSRKMRSLGAQLLFNVPSLYLGCGATVGGALVVDGDLYSPSLPTRLRDIGPHPDHWGTGAQIAAHHRLVAEREPYRLQRRNAQPGLDGRLRLGCPALAGKMACTLRPNHEVMLDLGKREAMQIHIPENPPQVCDQSTMTVDMGSDEADTIELGYLGKLFQKYPYGSREWYRSWNRRNRVEGMFGNVQTNVTEDIRRGVHRYMGRAALTVVATMMIGSANLRLVGTYRRMLQRRHSRDPRASQLYMAHKAVMRRQRAGTRHPLVVTDLRRDRRVTVTAAQVAALLPNAPPG